MEEQGKKIIRGYPILFDSPARIGDWTEYVRRGALDNVDLSELMLFGFHDTAKPLAKAGINMRTEVDDKGLFIEAELPDTGERCPYFAPPEETGEIWVYQTCRDPETGAAYKGYVRYVAETPD